MQACWKELVQPDPVLTGTREQKEEGRERAPCSSFVTALQQAAASLALQLPRVFPSLLVLSQWKDPFIFNREHACHVNTQFRRGLYILQHFLGLVTLRLFWSLKCLLRQIFIIVIFTVRAPPPVRRWPVARALECYKSVRPQSCSRTCCMISWNVLPFVFLFPHVWMLSPCPCIPWGGVEGLSVAQHGFESVSSAPESCRVTLNSTQAS